MTSADTRLGPAQRQASIDGVSGRPRADDAPAQHEHVELVARHVVQRLLALLR